MRLHQRSISKVTLLNVLRRRKSSLKKFLQETGIVTYELLKTRCDSMGVIPPEEDDFLKASGVESADLPRTVSSPAEGLIVLEPPDLVKENTGESFDLSTTSDQESEESDVQESDVEIQEAVSQNSQEESSKKKKKKN